MPDMGPQFTEETGTFSVAASTETNNTVSLSNEYAVAIAEIGHDGSQSPVNDVAGHVEAYPTNAAGNINQVRFRVHNTTAGSLTVRWKVLGQEA